MIETDRKKFLALIAISLLIAPRLSQAQITGSRRGGKKGRRGDVLWRDYRQLFESDR